MASRKSSKNGTPTNLKLFGKLMWQKCEAVFFIFKFLMLHQKQQSATRGFSQICTNPIIPNLYKTNREVQNLGILLHVGDRPLEPISLIWWFQKKKAINLPKSSKNLDCLIIFFLEIWQSFLKTFQKFLWPCCLGPSFVTKWQILATEIIICMKEYEFSFLSHKWFYIV